MSIYNDMGYDNREDYLQSLALDNSVPYYIVKSFANLLGPEEDFDSLVTEIEDFAPSSVTFELCNV